MFNKLFGGRQEAKRDTPMLFVCLKNADDLAWDRIKASLLQENLVSADFSSKAVGVFEFPDCKVSVAPMMAPVPGDEVAAQATDSRCWKQGDSTEHAAHAIVFGGTHESVAKVARAISLTHETVAWYCGSAGHILKPEVACAFVEKGMSAPVWVGVVASANRRGGVDVSTIGMNALGHLEFEIIGTAQKPGDVHFLLLDVAEYVIEHGSVLKHGQTFGRTDDERLPIEVGKSKLGKSGTVVRLTFP